MPAGQRRVAQVFQFPVLYPSLTVLDNLAFPLRTQGIGRRAGHQRARAIAALFGIDAAWLRAKPPALSLFQQQISGFAKAMVRQDTALVLLDEPLTAVEPAAKWRLRQALKDAQAELGSTMIYVTHDQTEALTFADRVGVLHDARLVQLDTPEALFDTPAHEEVARFIGSPGMNLLPVDVRSGVVCCGDALLGRVTGVADGAATLGFRADWARLSDAPAGLRLVPRQARLTGVSRGRREGLWEGLCADVTVRVAAPPADALPPSMRVVVQRGRLFRNRQALDAAFQARSR